jgi:prolyl-tRNA synthetase
MGGKQAHEFMCFLDVGEDTVVVCEVCGFAANREVVGNARVCTTCGGHFTEKRAVEVGNIFQLGTRYTDSLGVNVTDARGERRSVMMGSYGIGVSRLLACLVERFHDERGIALPAAVAPLDVHLMAVGRHRDELERLATCIEQAAGSRGLALLWDDRAAASTGERLADADLIGATLRVTLGNSTSTDGTAEVRERRSGRIHTVAVDRVVAEVLRTRKKILYDENSRVTRV